MEIKFSLTTIFFVLLLLKLSNAHNIPWVIVFLPLIFAVLGIIVLIILTIARDWKHWKNW